MRSRQTRSELSGDKNHIKGKGRSSSSSPGPRAPPLIWVEGRGNGTFTHLVELNPLFIPLGVGVWHPQSAKLCSEKVGRVPFHGRDVEAENLGGDAFWAGGQVVWNTENKIKSLAMEHIWSDAIQGGVRLNTKLGSYITARHFYLFCIQCRSKNEEFLSFFTTFYLYTKFYIFSPSLKAYHTWRNHYK